MSPKELKQYNNPGSFGNAFKSKYNTRPERALVILMQRFAARVCQAIDGAVVKGGLGLEMRLDTPRTTRDADIIISASHNLDARLVDAGKIDLGDFLRYSVTTEPRRGVIDAPGMMYPGRRYTVHARFATGPGPWPGDPFRKFTAEISVRSPAASDTFQCGIDEFPQIPVVPIRIYSLPWQIAEKVHAYTDPRHRETSNLNLMRPRDLLDVCRCASATSQNAKIDSEDLRLALQETFKRRKMAAQHQQVVLQDLPEHLPMMPIIWEGSFQNEVQRSSLPWRTSAEAHRFAAQFLDPILSGSAAGAWDPGHQRWIAPVAEQAHEPSAAVVEATEPDE
jgi:hypothetical protein